MNNEYIEGNIKSFFDENVREINIKTDIDDFDKTKFSEYSFNRKNKQNIKPTVNYIEDGDFFLKNLKSIHYEIEKLLKKRYYNFCFFTNIVFEMLKINMELIKSKRIIEQKNAELTEYTKLLEELTLKDSLTGAYNRSYFNETINGKIKKIKELNSKVSLAYIDFDNFKAVNDKLGHLEGDILLKRFVYITNNILKEESDTVIRIGGDEFIIISLYKNKNDLQINLNKINEELKKYTRISSLSYGIVEITADEIKHDFSIIDWLNEADKKMYFFKKKKKFDC